MKKPKHLAFAMLTLATLLCACSSDKESDNQVPMTPRRDIKLTSRQSATVAMQNDFAWKLMGSPGIKDQHTFALSPLSVAVDLGMLAVGAEEQTRASICTVLGYDDVISGYDDMLTTTNSILRELPTMDNRTTIAFAQAVWSRPGVDFNADYKSQILQTFGANVVTATGSLMNAINNWATQNTAGLINNLMQSEPDGNIGLLNATYFAGNWAIPFDVARTKKNKFTPDATAGAPRNIDMMWDDRTLPYAFNEQCELVTLAYGNGAFEMNLALPAQGTTVDDVLSAITSDSWRTLKASRQDTYTLIGLPRFTVKSRIDLNGALQQQGMDIQQGNYSRMAQGAWFNAVLQSTQIAVDEAGTVAASATVIEGVTSPGPSGNQVIFDRPFFFTIEETSTGALLFIGKVGAI